MKKSFRFVGVGIVSAAIYFAVSLSAITFFTVDVKIANAAAYLTGMTVSYLGHRHITFNSRGSVVREGGRFVITNVINLTLSTLLLMGLVDRFGLDRFAAIIVANIFVVISSFVIMQLWVFRPTGIA